MIVFELIDPRLSLSLTSSHHYDQATRNIAHVVLEPRFVGFLELGFILMEFLSASSHYSRLWYKECLETEAQTHTDLLPRSRDKGFSVLDRGLGLDNCETFAMVGSHFDLQCNPWNQKWSFVEWIDCSRSIKHKLIGNKTGEE
jgi:hypothetical protein